MKNIQTNCVYLHGGVKLSPKLVYGVPDDVADGLVKIGIAVISTEAADLSFETMAWDDRTRRYGDAMPDEMVNVQSDEAMSGKSSKARS